LQSRDAFGANLVLQAPVDFELEAVDLRLLADLPDEESVDRGESLPFYVLRKWTEQDFVRGMVLKRKLIDGAEGKPDSVAMPLDDFVLGADFEFPGFDALADVLPEEAFDDQLPSIGSAHA
jgi:hypothetical protein